MTKSFILSGFMCFVYFQIVLTAEDYSLSLRQFLLENQSYLQLKKSKEESDVVKECYVMLKNSNKLDSNMINILGIILNKKFMENDFRLLSDKKIFEVVFGLCQSDSPQAPQGLRMLGYFKPQMFIDRATIILGWFQTKKFSIDYFHYLPIELLKIPESNIYSQIAIDRLKLDMKQNPKGETVYLMEQARLGSEDAKNTLISIITQYNLEKIDEFYEYSSILTDFLKLKDQKINIFVLKEFEKNIGSPQFYAEKNIRYYILIGLYDQYPNDDFFEKYRRYFTYGRKYGVLPLDNELLGNEDAVKNFFTEFQEWARKRLNYEIKLDGIEYKICHRRRNNNVHISR